MRPTLTIPGIRGPFSGGKRPLGSWLDGVIGCWDALVTRRGRAGAVDRRFFRIPGRFARCGRPGAVLDAAPHQAVDLALCHSRQTRARAHVLSLGWTADATLHGCQQADDAAGQRASRSPTAHGTRRTGVRSNMAVAASIYTACFASSVTACEMVSQQREVRCDLCQQPAVGSARRMTLEHECACVCQRCIRQQYVSYVRNAHVTSRNYDPTLIPTVGFLTRCT